MLLVFGLGSYQKSFWIYSLIMGILGALGNGFLIKSLVNGELSVLGPINSYKAVIGLLFGMILLKEMPHTAGLIGMVLIIAGSYFVFDTMKEGFSLKLLKNKEIQYRFLALFFCAIEAVFIKKVILVSSVLDAFMSWCIFGAVFAVLWVKLKNLSFIKEFSVLKTRNASYFVNIVACLGMMQYTTNYIFTKMNVAYALSLFQLCSIVSILFGFKFFGEKHILKKLLGAFVMISGAVMIILYN